MNRCGCRYSGAERTSTAEISAVAIRFFRVKARPSLRRRAKSVFGAVTPATNGMTAEQRDRGQRLVSEVVAWSQVNCRPSRCLGALQRARKGVEAVPVIVRVDERQHRPTVGVRNGRDGALEALRASKDRRA
jgi:hypothetical protein